MPAYSEIGTVRHSAGARCHKAEHRKVKNRGQEEEEEAVGNDKAHQDKIAQ